jgi:hypothetical protein
VVGGYGFPLVARALAEGRAKTPALARLPIQLVENTSFRDGNLISLLTARPRLSEGFVLLNVDHIYRSGIAAVVAPDVVDVTAFIDTDRSLGADDMKVERRPDGRVRRIAKTLTKFDSGYVGMTRVPSTALPRYWQTAEAALAEEGRAIHVERILGRLAESDAARGRHRRGARRCRAGPALCVETSAAFVSAGWLEVDTAEERAAAEQTLLHSPRDAGRDCGQRWQVGPCLLGPAGRARCPARDHRSRGRCVSHGPTPG